MGVAVTVNFLESAFMLDKKLRRYTMDAISQLDSNPDSPSLSCHRINKLKCDPSFWSARVNDDVRIIFSLNGDLKTLLYVDHHEDAYHWCEGKYLRSTSFGATMLYDDNLMAKADEDPEAQVFYQSQEKPLLEVQGIKKKQLLKIDIPETHANNLMNITDEDQFLDYIQIFPQELQEALLSLETGERTFQEVYNDLVDDDFNQGKTDQQKDTKRRIHLLQNLGELEQILQSDDFERWTVFLHPEQEKLVTMNVSGPALIEGGPGTGKTVVGMHRAVHLASQVFPQGRVLICTFSKKLARYIQEKLYMLEICKNVECPNIDVQSIDSYILSLYGRGYKKQAQIANATELRNLIRRLYHDKPPASGSLSFYIYEYFEVIERNHIETLSEYLSCNRAGSGGPPLNAAQRQKAWSFIEKILSAKEQQNRLSFVDVAHLVLKALEKNQISKTYDSIIIDEAQDLEPVKLKVLERSTIGNENSLFILSDLNQRIFRLNSWKSDAGINVVGRTRYLTVNYRTTKEISDYARDQFVSSELIRAHIRDYKSIMNGVPPMVEGFPTEQEQQKYLITVLQEQMVYCPPEQICIICPQNEDCNKLSGVLSFVGIPHLILQGDTLPEKGKGVNLCTVRGVKGLEFRIIFLYNYLKIDAQCQAESGNSETFRDAYRKMAECEKYVATTRAREELYITYVEEEASET